YRIIDFFISLLDSFRVENDLSNSTYLLDIHLKEWNERTRSVPVTNLSTYVLLTRGNRCLLLTFELIKIMIINQRRCSRELHLFVFSSKAFGRKRGTNILVQSLRKKGKDWKFTLA